MKNIIKGLAFLNMVILASTTQVASQSIDLAADKIPDSLLKNAVAVTRLEDEVFEVTDIDRATYKCHSIVTVLNERGSDELVFVHYGDKFHKLGDFELKVYDANGKFVVKYKKKDLSTFNIGDGLIDDGIRHYLVVQASAYPITIETDYDINYKGLLNYPKYSLASPYRSVIQSSFTAIVPKQNGLRYKAQNTSVQPDKKDDGKNLTYRWSTQNQTAFHAEEGALSSAKLYPAILLAPNRFKIDDYEGDLSSWKSFGLWYAEVQRGTDVLNDEKVSFYKNLVKDAGSNREKIRTVYQYMQKNFRYVSIQLGIGGWKPLPASFTDDKKYGDCKGLSNYMYAVLKSLGIRSHMVIINSAVRDDGEDPDFAISRFNHAILMVPDGKDSIWLECTSKTLPFGVLSYSTQNKNAVVITDKGGFLVATPASSAKENVLAVKTVIQLDEAGSGNCLSSIEATGEFKETLIHNVTERKRDEQKAFLVRYFGYKQPDDFVITAIADPFVYKTNVELAIEKVSEFTAGSKMFLATHIYKYFNNKMPDNEKRQRDYYFDAPFVKADTTIFRLPEGFIVDQLPASKSFSGEVADYASSYAYNESEKSVYSITKLELKKHKIKAEQYPAAKDFFDKVLKEESQRIVIKKDPSSQQQPPARKAGF